MRSTIAVDAMLPTIVMMPGLRTGARRVVRIAGLALRIDCRCSVMIGRDATEHGGRGIPLHG